MPSQIDISIIIVSYNCLEALKSCLASLQSQKDAVFEIIVVDNDSCDGSSDFIKTQNVTGIFPGKNLGYGAAINLAVRQASGQYLYILNPDTTVPSGGIRAMADFADSHPGFGLISPLLIHPNGENQISAREFPRRRDLVLGRGSPLYKLGLSSERQAGYIDNHGEKPLQVPAVSATAVIIKTSIFLDMGGFDERFFMYMEDVDLCYRLSQRALAIWIVPPIKVIHGWRKSSSRRPYFTAFHHHLSVYKYFRKHNPNQRLRNLILAIILIMGYTLSVLIIKLKGSNPQ